MWKVYYTTPEPAWHLSELHHYAN